MKSSSVPVARPVVLGIFVLLAGALLIWWQSQVKPDSRSAEATIEIRPPPLVDNHPAAAPSGTQSGIAKPSAPVPPAINDFKDWAARYLKSSPEIQPSLLADGETLADAHRLALKQLIVNDPRAALEQAVPMVVRQKLPASMVARIEQRINTRGSYEVLAVSPDSPPEEPTVRRFSTINGKELRTWVYGRRTSQTSVLDLPLHGIAIDREFALSESPLRVLEVGEIPDAAKPLVNVCPISKLTTPVPPDDAPITADTPAVDDGRQIIYLCDGGHIRLLEEELTAAEGQTGGPVTPTGTTPIIRSSSTGLRKFIYMRVVFPDALQAPQTEKDAWANGKTLTDYYQENSAGRTFFMGTITPVLVLPRTAAWYIQDYNTTSSNSPIMTDAKEAARALGYIPDDYQHFACIYTGGPGTFGGLGSVGGSNTWLRSTSVGTFEHEFGHNTGVWHSNFWDTGDNDVIGPGANVEYGHTFDVMGSSGSAGHFNASQKEKLQWILPEAYHTVLGSGTYRIHQFDQVLQDPARRYAIKVAKDGDRDYWLEFRQKLTTNPWFTSGISINWSPWGNGSGSTNSTATGSNAGTQLLDMTPWSADDRNDSPLTIGRTFSDWEAGIHLTPIGKGGTIPESMDVVVNVGDVLGNTAPLLAIGASSTTPAVNAAITLTAIASDAEDDPLAYFWDFGDKLASFNGNSFSNNNSAIQTKSYTAAGHYNVRCTVSDMKGGSITRSLLITVGTPTKYYMEGTVTAGGIPLPDVRVGSSTTVVTQTDSNGIYRLTGLSGTVTLSALQGGYAFTAGFTNPKTLTANSTGNNWTATESLPRVTVTSSDPDAAEATVPDPASITLTRTGSTAAALPVYLDFQGTATTSDYTLSPVADTTTASPLEVFTIAAGSATLDIIVTPKQDTIAEGPETILVSLINGPGYQPRGNQITTLTIADDDTTKPLVSLVCTDPEAAEEDPGNTARFLFTRTGDTSASLTVSFTNDTSSGTATAGSDYTAIGTSVVIPASQSSAAVIITPINDSIVEGLELVKLTIATNSNYIVGTPSTATAKIIDDDINVVSLTATDATANENGDPGQFTATRSGDTTQPLIVHYGIGGDATHGVDYQPLSGVISFAAGSGTSVIDIIPINDEQGEPSQTIILQLRSGTTYLIGANNRATVTLNDDGDPPSVSINATDGTASEGSTPGTGTFRITTTGTGTGNITVNYAISGTATNGVDYTTLSGNVSIGKNTTANITLTPINDSILENTETVTLTLIAGAAYSLDPDRSATIAITDDDQPVQISTSANDLTVTEGGTSSFYLSRTGPTTSALTVSYTMSGTATSGSDYTALSGSVSIPAAASGAFVTLTTIDDTASEGTETVIVNVTLGPTYGLNIGSATIRIIDNDNNFTNTIAFEAAGTTVEESQGAGGINVTRTGTITQAATVEYGIVTGTASGGGIDYTLDHGTLAFAAGENSRTIPFAIIDDVLPEEIEVFTVQLRNAAGAAIGTRSQHSVLIQDNEPRVSIRAIDPFAQEGTSDTGRFRVTRIGNMANALVVPITVSGTATSGSDFTNLGTSVTIPAGSRDVEIPVTAPYTAGAEALETVIVTLGPSGNFVATVPVSATVTIMDQETEEPPQVAITSPSGNSPGVTAGSGVVLRGVVSDEGSPAIVWSKVSGPGTVNFENATTAATTATFATAGSYVLRLTANDGVLIGAAEVTVIYGGSGNPWNAADIGSTALAGASANRFGGHAIVGGGNSITGTTDNFFFKSRALSGDGTLTARVRSTTFSSSSARIGIMLRDGTANNVRMAAQTLAPITGNTSVFNYRSTAGGSASTSSLSGITPGYWVRLKRVGNSFSAYDSPDGANWTQRGSSQTLAMGSTVQAGLAVMSASTTRLNTAILDNITLTGAAANIGPVVAAGPDASPMLTQSMSVSLAGTYADDSAAGGCTTLWSQVSGSGVSNFPNASAPVTTALVSVPGTYIYRITADDGEISTYDDVILTITSPITTWRIAKFGANAGNPAIAGDAADPDQDGSVNLLEYALLTDPTIPGNTNGIPGTSGTFRTFTYTRPADALDVTYEVQWSESLTNWQITGVTQSPVSVVGNVMTVRAQVPISVSSDRCFMRILVTRP